MAVYSLQSNADDMIPGHITNISVRSLLLQCFVGNAAQHCEAWFREYTGKKYILLTSSCRSALFLAYAASEGEGEVITSPMTCISALDPVIMTGTSMKFTDISPSTLLMDIDKMESSIDEQTRFIHAIHHGGLMLDTVRLAEIASQHNLILIEDCAQAFGASHLGTYAGVMGDVACFSMIKNGYGIGGGILATDNPDLFRRAMEIQSQWKPFSNRLLLFRIVRSLLENKRMYLLGEWLFKRVMAMRGKPEEADPERALPDKIQLRPGKLFFRLFRIQQRRFGLLHARRRSVALRFAEMLSLLGIRVIADPNQQIISSFDKLFCYHPRFDVVRHIPMLLEMGIEARHLENRYGAIRQPRLDEFRRFKGFPGLMDCHHYFDIHEKIIHLPLHEKLKDRDMEAMVMALKKILQDESTD